MDIEVRDKKKEDYILQVGDIVVSKIGDVGVVMIMSCISHDEGKYAIRNINQDSWFNGSYDNLELLTASVISLGWTIYPQSEYKLVLERK